MLVSTSDVVGCVREFATLRKSTSFRVRWRTTKHLFSLDTFQPLADGFRTGTTPATRSDTRSLCHRCNNFGNKHYVGLFAQWTRTPVRASN